MAFQRADRTRSRSFMSIYNTSGSNRLSSDLLKRLKMSKHGGFVEVLIDKDEQEIAIRPFSGRDPLMKLRVIEDGRITKSEFAELEPGRYYYIGEYLDPTEANMGPHRVPYLRLAKGGYIEENEVDS